MLKKRAPAALAPCGTPRVGPVVLAEDFSLLMLRRRIRVRGPHRKVALLH